LFLIMKDLLQLMENVEQLWHKTGNWTSYRQNLLWITFYRKKMTRLRKRQLLCFSHNYKTQP
jgi:hypothetical protein